jgi:hypothetical protein
VHLSRRTLLAGTGLVLVACSQDTAVPETRSTEPAALDPTQQVELNLIALYTAVRAAFPALDQPLKGIQAQHEAHLTALDGELGEIQTPPIARTPEGALDQCVLAETQAANAHQQACLGAAPELARLLTLISASEASHIPALEQLR